MTEPVTTQSDHRNSALPINLLSDTASVAGDGALSIGGVDLAGLADRFGTPLFVYDEAQLRNRCREAISVFGPGGAIYATKAFLCRAMARLAYEEGMKRMAAATPALEESSGSSGTSSEATGYYY